MNKFLSFLVIFGLGVSTCFGGVTQVKPEYQNQIQYQNVLWNTTDLATFATFSPTNLTNCVMWLDASQITGLTNGAQVDTWNDMSGAANNATRDGGSTASYPQYKTNVVNGKPVVRFSTDSRSGFNFPRRTDIRTVFWVVREEAVDDPWLLGDSAAGGTYHFHRGPLVGTNGQALWYPVYASPDITGGVTKLMGDIINGTTTPLVIHPSTDYRLVSVVTTGNVSAAQISTDRNTAARSWNGDIAEIIIYNRALTSDEENQVGYYLTQKYGLTTSYGQ